MQSWFDYRAGILTLLFSLAGALPFIATSKDRRDHFFFDVTLTSSAPGMTQLFWDAGKGMSEYESSGQPLRAETQPRVYRYMLPARNLTALRFDIIDREATMTMKDARIVDRAGHVLYTFKAEQFSAGNQIDRFERAGDTITVVTTRGANDPMVDVHFDRPIELKATRFMWIRPAAPYLILIWIVGLALGAPAVTSWLGNYTRRIGEWAARNPRLALVCVSVAATAVQSHPVIFCGRSYVSPNNGSLMLYDHLPTLPGYTRTDFEGGMGSDVGALLFQHLYYPMVQREALRQGELPLWNRYSLTGLPLLGQGQSMFGDPLNFITIAADGAAWAWDVRFCLAHILLALGSGLAVWNFTRRLSAAALIALASSFVGMFLFRINHPATFSFCYGSLILWAWSALVVVPRGRELLALGALLLANWMELTSGTAKEAYIILVFLNGAGCIVLWLGRAEARLRKLGLAVGTGVVLLLLATPLWMTFLVTLKHSFTSYDVPSATPYSLRECIGLFDELFFQQAFADEHVIAPALNVFFLLGMLAWLVAPKRENLGRIGIALFVASLLPFTIAFGIVPPALVVKIPFIANIGHVGNTFSCAVLLVWSIVAGIGLATFSDWAKSEGAWIRVSIAALVTVILAAIYFTQTRDHAYSSFFRGYAPSLAVASLGVALAGIWAARSGQTRLIALGLIVGLPLLCWRCAQWVTSPFDEYVWNPAERVDFHATSPATKAVDSHLAEPARVIGLENNLFPAYNTTLRWESLYGVDAVKSRYYFEVASAADMHRVWLWDNGTLESEAAAMKPVHDFLNVEWYVTNTRPAPHAVPGLELVGQYDLDVYRSHTAWPRAFFTDAVVTYSDARDLIRRVHAGDGKPFAAAEGNEPWISRLTRRLPGRSIVPAKNYALTANTTTFEIDAPKAGIVVLTEAYYPDDFIAELDGRRVPYFRVNHAFKGIAIRDAGPHVVTFSYWPQHFTIALSLSAVGALLAAAGSVWLARSVKLNTTGRSPSAA